MSSTTDSTRILLNDWGAPKAESTVTSFSMACEFCGTQSFRPSVRMEILMKPSEENTTVSKARDTTRVARCATAAPKRQSALNKIVSYRQNG